MVLPGFKGMPLNVFCRRLGRVLADHAAMDGAAELAYYFLFSLFPLLFFLLSFAAYLPLRGPVETMLNRAADVVPSAALQPIREQIDFLLTQSHPKLLTLGLVVALYSASRGLDAFRRSLNMAYSVTESRSYLRTQLLALGATIVTALLVIAAVAALVLGGKLGALMAARLGITAEAHLLWSWLRWPAMALLIMLVAALSYYWLPDVEQEFKFITPGSVASAVVWLIASWGLTEYTDHFGRFNATYGSLGGAVVLLTWLYLTALIFVLGGEMNAVIEQASPEGKRPGARVPGVPPEERGYVTPPGAAKSRASARRWRWSFKRNRPPPPGVHP